MSPDWPAIRKLVQADQPCALLTIVGTKGSVPREAGTRMLVTADKCMGTIGGGQLEYRAVDQARDLLRDTETACSRSLHSFTLGPELKQCCGGVVELTIDILSEADSDWLATVEKVQVDEPCVLVGPAPKAGKPVRSSRLVVTASDVHSPGKDPAEASLVETARSWLAATREPHDGACNTGSFSLNGQHYLFERSTGPEFQLFLFGAGHVGKALVEVLAPYPCRITWVDSRAAEFPVSVPDNVQVKIAANPAELVATAPDGAFYLVMTHSHPLDFELCKTVLNRNFAYLGLIGSKSKRARFRKNLKLKGVDAAQLERLTCPIGIDAIRGKHPAAIAVAVAAQLIELCEQREAQTATVTGVPARAEA